MTLQYDNRHGSPHDRGGADAYYRRPHIPHKVDEITGDEVYELTPEEVSAYTAGYEAARSVVALALLGNTSAALQGLKA